MRRAFNPNLRASSRYASTTASTSRGGTLCRSKTSVMGMRTGSSIKKPGLAAPNRASSNFYCAHPMPLRYVLSAGSAHDRFDLILGMEFQFLQSDFFHLLRFSQVGPLRQIVQFMS